MTGDYKTRNTIQGKVVTANKLMDGAVIYLAAGGSWTEVLAGARFLTDEAEQTRLLQIAAQDVDRRIILDPYLMAAKTGANGPEPISQRERIRATGPTVPTRFDSPNRKNRTGHVSLRRV